jgi:hypothetical protein
MGWRLHRCPFSAHLCRLRPDLLAGCVDIEGDGKAVRKSLRSLILDTRYVPACDYCNGRFLDDPEIPAAKQIKEPRTMNTENPTIPPYLSPGSVPESPRP